MIFNIDHYGNNPVLWDDASTQWLSYQELSKAITQNAAFISALDRPLILQLADSTIASVIVYLAALEANAPIALFPASLPPERVEALIKVYRPSLVVNAGEIDGYRTFDGLAAPGQISENRQFVELHPDLAQLLPTSGSTGSPKLVRLSGKAVTSNASSIGQALGITSDQRAALNLPLSYSYGLSVLNSHLMAGASIFLSRESVLSREWWAQLAKHNITSMPGVPTTYEMLARLDCETLFPPSLQTLTQAGGALSLVLARKFNDLMVKRSGKMFIMYGQTEATARMSILDAGDLQTRLGSVGRAIPYGRFVIKPVPGMGEDGSGEVVYHGPNVMMGYADKVEDLAHGDDLQGELNTGDLGQLDSDGFLTITGRLKRIIKLAGLRINLDEIEAFARQICPAAALESGNKLLIFAETSEVKGLKQHVQSQALVPPTLMRVQTIQELPKLANGKVDYPALQRSLT